MHGYRVLSRCAFESHVVQIGWAIPLESVEAVMGSQGPPTKVIVITGKPIVKPLKLQRIPKWQYTTQKRTLKIS